MLIRGRFPSDPPRTAYDARALRLRGTRSDAKVLADNLGVDLRELPIEAPRRLRVAVTRRVRCAPQVGPHREETPTRVIRANLLMALSNKFGWLGIHDHASTSRDVVGYRRCTWPTAAGGLPLVIQGQSPNDGLRQSARTSSRARASRPRNPVPSRASRDRRRRAARPIQRRLTTRCRRRSSPDPEGYVSRDLRPRSLIARGLPAEAESTRITACVSTSASSNQRPPDRRFRRWYRGKACEICPATAWVPITQHGRSRLARPRCFMRDQGRRGAPGRR